MRVRLKAGSRENGLKRSEDANTDNSEELALTGAEKWHSSWNGTWEWGRRGIIVCFKDENYPDEDACGGRNS